ncbi:MAG: SDR family oxidoreductase [Magnetospiraceae bacterium]
MSTPGNTPHNRLFVFGLGYSATALATALIAEGWVVAGTVRNPDGAEKLKALGIEAHVFDGMAPLDPGVFAETTHVLGSIPPGTAGDPALIQHKADLAALPSLRWVGYYSTAGVYGDAGGALVDESRVLQPSSARARRRVMAEADWRGLGAHLFRLAGIYGPGRSPLDRVRDGNARCIVKPGHKFSRIHVADIVAVTRAAMARPNPGAAYNVCDDEPAEPAEVIRYACHLLGVTPPPDEPFEQARSTMSAMALSFWKDNRVLVNRRLHEKLGVILTYPTYREGLRAILAENA